MLYLYMTALAQSLSQQLPFEERLQLIWDLWDSIETERLNVPLTDAQRTEVQKSLDEYLADGDDGEPWDIVRKSISKK